MKTSIPSYSRQWLIAFATVSALVLSAMPSQAQSPIKNVWYILMENHNWTSGTPYDSTGGPVLLGNTAAPYINSLINASSPRGAQVSYCACYHNVLATATGTGPSIHPSEPNYVWMEAGNNLSKADDADPYGSGTSVLQIYNYLAANPGETAENLCGLLQAAGISWKSYQEDTDLLTTAGNNVNVTSGTNDLTGAVAPSNLWSVPLQSFSGTGSGHYINRYNETALYNFACKHDGSLFFVPTNGSTITTPNYANGNPETFHFAPLQQLALDLSATACAAYNVITPDLYNDMHTALPAGITYSGTGGLASGALYTGAAAQVAQGDNFLRIIVPMIQASPQYKAGGMIVLWTDESEGTNENDFNHTMMEIIISPYAKGTSYKSLLNYTHSSDVATLQEIFGLVANSPTGYLGDACNFSNSSGSYAGVGNGKGSAGFGTGGTFGGGQALDLSDLFVANTIPTGLPVLRTSASGYTVNQGGTESQMVTVTNTMSSAITTPIYLEAAYLNTTLANSAGTTTTEQPIGSPYVQVTPSGLAPGESASVVLTFNVPSGNATISDSLSAFTTSGTP